LSVDTAYLAPNKISSDVVPLDRIVPSALNPRKHFDPDKLQELADSIKHLGLMEPIVVRWLTLLAAGAKFEIVAGERRYRAAILAGLAEVPIRNLGFVDDKIALEMALVENLQRADLDPIEEAEGYASLNRVVGLKQAQIAAAVHRSQPTIANRMRLLDLPVDVQERIRKGELSPSHGVALAKLSDFPAIVSEIAAMVIKNRWTSGQIEQTSLPFGYELTTLKLAKSLSYQAFNTDVCTRACPFQAYRRANDYSAFCLNPDHYEQLEHEAINARTAAWRAKEEERRAKLAEKDPEAVISLPPVESITVIESARGSDYPEIGDHPPEGCTEDCPCRGEILQWGRFRTVCKDPARFKKLSRSTTITDNRERRADAKALRTKLATRLESLTEFGQDELLILAVQALAQQIPGHKVTPAWHKVARVGDTMHDGRTLASLETLALAGGDVHLVRLALAAILGAELDEYHEGGRGKASLTDWYLDDGNRGSKDDLAVVFGKL
jgi:ParB/RepB/Spo0J family partition protein